MGVTVTLGRVGLWLTCRECAPAEQPEIIRGSGGQWKRPRAKDEPGCELLTEKRSFATLPFSHRRRSRHHAETSLNVFELRISSSSRSRAAHVALNC